MDLYNIRKKLNMGIPLSSINLRVTNYSRVSTEHLEQKNSLKNQVEYFDEMIKNNKNWIYVNGYYDYGISGTTDYKRNNFMKMIDDAKNGKFDLIITKEISRFSRNTLDSIKYTRELLSYGVAVLFINDNINTALPDSELRLTIMASMAQDEIRRLSERVKFGMNRSIKNGNILGNNMLYGYRKDRQTGNLVIVNEEAKIVKRLFDLYTINNWSITKIAKIFNEEGIKTVQNKKWCASTLIRMIKNPKYKGYYCGKKSEVIDYMTKRIKQLPEKNWIMYEDKNRIPPIVDEFLWIKANKKLKSINKTLIKKYKKFLLSTKLICEEDNEFFIRRIQCVSSKDVTWVCAKHIREGKKTCNVSNIRESEIYKILNDIYSTLEINIKEIYKELLTIYINEFNNKFTNKSIDEINNLKQKIYYKKDKLLELIVEGNLSKEEFNNKNNEYNNQIDILNKELNLLKNNNRINDFLNEKRKLKVIIKHIVNSKIIKDKLLDLLINKIVVSSLNNTKDLRLKIYLNFSKEKIINNKIILKKDYFFKRGFNTNNTKRYIIKYRVLFYFLT